MNNEQHGIAAVMYNIAAIQARIATWQSMLQSGAYLNETVHHGDGTPLTDIEKRDRVLRAIQALTDNLQRCHDYHASKHISGA